MERRSGFTRDAVWTLFRDLIHERTGIYFDEDNVDLMAGKITDLMAEYNVDAPLDYYYRLKYEGPRGAEWPNLVNTISVRETYFWREMDQIRTLVDVLTPRLAREFNEPLRIWSAACATGEEPLTIAMALDHAGWLDRLPVEIYASDLSPASLCAAQRGVYRERAFRCLPDALRERYFTRVSGGWEVDPALRSRIQWRRANLIDKRDIEDLARSRVIFCRNVFIYFSESVIRRVAAAYAECMPRPGYLFVGAAESLLKFTTQFQLQQVEGSFVYVKE